MRRWRRHALLAVMATRSGLAGLHWNLSQLWRGEERVAAAIFERHEPGRMGGRKEGRKCGMGVEQPKWARTHLSLGLTRFGSGSLRTAMSISSPSWAGLDEVLVAARRGLPSSRLYCLPLPNPIPVDEVEFWSRLKVRRSRGGHFAQAAVAAGDDLVT